ncbi:MAG: hypothetical protein AMS20_05515 [Gemmatimonas sp. SG8_28]|nr:MAG: hypothetical protein AMS20_05515 [Gemmatimonas sp. SG8_28]
MARRAGVLGWAPDRRSLHRPDGLDDLLFGQEPLGFLGLREHGVDRVLIGRQPSRSEEEQHVRGAGHVADLDLLLASHPAGRDPRVDPIGEPRRPFAFGLDDGGRMHTGGRAERVATDDRRVDRDRDADGGGNGFDVVRQGGEIVVPPAEQSEVHQELLHRCIAHALTNAQGGAVHASSTGLECGDRVGDVQAAVPVAVPVDTDVIGDAALVEKLPDP